MSVTTILTYGTLLLNIAIIAYLILKLLKKAKTIDEYIKEYAFKAALALSIIATAGSLYYSNYVGLIPCSLCWFQRIFIYPQIVILTIGILRKDKNAAYYSLTLAIISTIISIYHYIVQRVTDFSPNIDLATPCTIGGECSSKFIFAFNYITMPFMALTVGVTIIILMKSFISSKNNK